MRIDSVDIHEFSGAVTNARSATTDWTTRAGMILRVRTPDGLIGQGEASPLPGYSRDAYASALAALRSVEWAWLPEPDVPESPATLMDRLRALASSTPVPSAAFALETAYLDLVGQKAARPIWRLLAGTDEAVSPVPICSLIGSADDPGVVDAARGAIARGVASVKLKLSGPSSDDRLARLCSIRAAIGDAGLRLDANGSIPAESARSELAKLRALDVEFIEEPVVGSSLDSLAEPTVPIALDESLQDESAWSRVGPASKRFGCVALVLKPMALGGFSKCLAWAERARERGLHVTVSHLFDGPVALTACAHLALAVGSRRYGSGLDLHGALGAWPAARLPLHSDGAILANVEPGLGLGPLPGGAL
jgi:o-succinylbenzoate synthase